MIEHLFIKNFKAFKKESIVLASHMLFIGTNRSGKTTILEALDTFFNHHLPITSVRNKKQDVVLECLINEKRYRKVFSPPHYTFNAHLSIGNFNEINHIKYLYMPQKPHTIEHFYNQCLSLNYTLILKETPYQLQEQFPYFFNKLSQTRTHPTIEYTFRLKTPLNAKTLKALRAEMLQEAPLEEIILGIDRVENSLLKTDFSNLIPKTYQTFITTRQKELINTYPYTVMPLYKQNIQKEMSIYTHPLDKKYQKTMLLVEGKYDVPWFETALSLLNLHDYYRVIPCGGYGNIPFVQAQFEKEGIQTKVIVDGDAFGEGHKLSRDVIELYADINYINNKFNTRFKTTPNTKNHLFNSIKEKDDVVKKVLSSWAKNYLTLNSSFIKEIKPWLNKL